jgi:hypothetical protein
MKISKIISALIIILPAKSVSRDLDDFQIWQARKNIQQREEAVIEAGEQIVLETVGLLSSVRQSLSVSWIQPPPNYSGPPNDVQIEVWLTKLKELEQRLKLYWSIKSNADCLSFSFSTAGAEREGRHVKIKS